jgi:hypothetical protein
MTAPLEIFQWLSVQEDEPEMDKVYLQSILNSTSSTGPVQ